MASKFLSLQLDESELKVLEQVAEATGVSAAVFAKKAALAWASSLIAEAAAELKARDARKLES